jgi:sarcosine oxidase, subunit beta
VTEPELAERYDVIVVGAGLLGGYTAWQLAARGARVLVLDQGIAGDGSTGRSSGGLRRQFTSQYEIELSTAGLEFYRRLEADPDFPGGIERVGYVFLAGADQAGVLERSYRTQCDAGVDVEWLDAGAVRDAFPYCDPDGVVAGTRTADDGFIDPWDVHQWVWRRARERGVALRQHCAVTGAHRDGPDWVVVGARRPVRSGQIVLAAGAWTGELADRIGIRVPVTPSPRVKVLTDQHPQLPADMPLITDLGTGAYVRSEHGCALVGARPEPVPVGHVFDTGLEHLATIVGRAAARFPSLDRAGLARAVFGFYELTPDGLPIAGEIAGLPGLWVVGGFNGHGIMHGPAVADAVVAAMTGDHGAIDLGPLAPDRFETDARPTTISLL